MVRAVFVITAGAFIAAVIGCGVSGEGPCLGEVDLSPYEGCIADVQLGYTPRRATQPGCVPTFFAPADCPIAPDAQSNTCTRTVTVTCDSGEVDTITVTWAGGCVPQVHQSGPLCARVVDAGSDAMASDSAGGG